MARAFILAVLFVCAGPSIKAATVQIGAVGTTNATGYYLEADGSFNTTGKIMIGTFSLTQTGLLSLIAGWGDNTATYDHYTNLLSYFTQVGTGGSNGSVVAGWTFNTNGAVSGTSSGVDTAVIPTGSQLYAMAFTMTNFTSNDFTTNTQWGLFTGGTNWLAPASPSSKSLVVSQISASGALIGTDLSLTATNAVQSNSVETTLGSTVYLTWNNASGNGNWNTNTSSTNWSLSANNIYFSNSNNVRIDNTAMGTGTVSVTNTGVAAGLIGVTNTNGSTITLGGGGIAAFSFNKSGAGALVVSNTLSLSNGFTNSGSGVVTLAGNVTAGSVTQSGSGTLSLTGSNSYAGGTTVTNGGKLTFVGDSAFGVGSVSLASNSSLYYSGTGVTSLSNSLTGYGSLTASGGGTLTLTGVSSGYSGSIAVSAGELDFQNSFSLGSGNLSLADTTFLSYTGSGNASILNNLTVTSGRGIISNQSGSLLTLGGTLTKTASILQLSGGSYNVTGKITGNSGSYNSDLVLSNAVVTLSTAADYYGPTLLTAGSTLTAGVNNALPTSTILTIGGTSESSSITNAFNLNGYSQTLQGIASGTGAQNQIYNSSGTAALLTIASNSLFGGSINGSNLGLIISNASVTLTGNSSYTGQTLLTNAASLSLTNSGFLTGTTNIQVSAGSTFLLGASNQVNSSAALTLSGGKLSLAAAAPGYRASTQTFASLTLTANSVIDFGALPGTSSLTFGSITGLASNHTLSIWDWNGTTLWGTKSETGGVGQYTRLYDSLNTLSATELSYISFYSGAGTGFLGTGGFSGSEIVPVPEPAVVLSSLLLLGWLVLSQHARITRRRSSDTF